MDPLLLLMYAAPVALAALGETVTQRSGIINIGLEGSMLMAAFFGMDVARLTGNPWLGVLGGIAAALATGLLFGWLTISLAADQVVVGTAINLLALGLTGTLFRSLFGQSGQLLSVPKLSAWHGIDPLMIVLLVSVPVIGVLLFRTGWGLAVRSVGEYPKAAEAAGFSVARLRYSALLLGSVFAGLAGVYLSLVISGSFAENMTSGRGFVAIAMVTFGRWRPLWAFGAAMLIGFAESLQFKFQAFGWKLPFQLFTALPYLLALLVLVLLGKGTIAPTALGKPYRREG